MGVDSQELDDEREPVRLMAFLAKRFAFGRLFQTTVELLPGPEARDDYGRLLAFVRTADGDVFNVTLVREGYAFAFLKFPFDESLRKDLKAAESEARRASRGLWREEPYPVDRSRGGGPARRRGPDRPLPLPALVQARRLPPARGRGGGFRCGHPPRSLPVAPRLPRFRGPDAPRRPDSSSSTRAVPRS
ncbi:MAG: thermonuclease family protein [Candidatus Moduliflexus flocculans]|nr:thermonuclease family protein [Candidatus Moduliflexus flocculans]